MKLFALYLALGTTFLAQGVHAYAQDDKKIYIRSISMFRSQVELAIPPHSEVRTGSHLLAQSATPHKCLLVVTRINGTSAYTDASRCTGFATLKKGQTVQLTSENDLNEEIREATKTEVDNTPH